MTDLTPPQAITLGICVFAIFMLIMRNYYDKNKL